MKIVSTIVVLFLLVSHSLNAQSIPSIARGALAATAPVTEIVGSVEFEMDIKFSFMQHSSLKSEYNIAFFANTTSSPSSNEGVDTRPIEFWGHGRNYLSIYGPLTVHLQGDSLATFRRTMIDTYNYFNQNISRRKLRYEHVDIEVLDDLIFSCYMDRETPKCAFWYKQNKYPLLDTARDMLFDALNGYYPM